MKLENAVKFFSPKSPSLCAASPATDTSTLTGSDVMAAFGMCQARAGFGMSAYLGKCDVSDADKVKAVEELVCLGLKLTAKSRALSRLTPVQRVKVVKVLAVYAYSDYCRSAAMAIECGGCGGKGLVCVKPKVTSGAKGEVTDISQKLCSKCGGKGVISIACRDCRGRGEAVDKEASLLQGVPVKKSCKRCNGLGYSKLKQSAAHRAIKAIIGELAESTWRYAYKPILNQLVSECYSAESAADREIKRATHD